MIIYPPFIADTIPAFTNDKIVIPFQQNTAVDEKGVVGFRLKIKNYQTSKSIATLYIEATTEMFEKQEIEFTNFTNIESKKEEEFIPETSQYYKFQLSYDDSSNYYAYSSASIGRCIGQSPTISIIKQNNYLYQGNYTTSLLSEPIYSYRFVLSDANTNLILYDSDNILHNVDEDVIDYNTKTRTSHHNFKLKYEGNNMKLCYIITTINGYTQEAELNNIAFIDNNIENKQYLKLSQDQKAKQNGYVKIQLNDLNDNFWQNDNEYIIERKISSTNKWEELIQFSIIDLNNVNSLFWCDYAVEQGLSYKYAIKNQNDRYIINTEIEVEFEDSFLLDAEKQLNIKYNTRIPSFKNNILEQKIETIGNKYPFFFRNGQVNYKEFSISGLLSHLMDENEGFISKHNLGLVETADTNLTDNNIMAERKFKLAVLDWLTNGKPKLFKSPTEGMYLVRLMNVTLSPNDTLGRMLHTFSATAYEIGGHEIEDLIANTVISFPNGEKYQPSSMLGLFVLGTSSLG